MAASARVQSVILRVAIATVIPVCVAASMAWAAADVLHQSTTSQPSYVYVDGADATPDDSGCGDLVNPCNTIQRGVDVALSGDTVWVAPFVYHEHVRIQKNIIVRGEDPESVILDGDGVQRVVTVFSQATVDLVDMVVRNGRAVEGGGVNVGGATVRFIGMEIANNTATVEGGGVYVGFDSTAVFSRTLVTGNQVLDPLGFGRGGGGIVSLEGSTLTVLATDIADNSATNGGGVASMGALTMRNCEVTGNEASGKGGGVWTAGSAEIDQCILTGNRADSSDLSEGGAVHNSGETLISRSALSDNHAGRAGGALFNDNGTIVLTDTALTNGSALTGGGIFNSTGAGVDAERCTISGNRADDGAGARNEGSLALTNVTVSANAAFGDGGGLLNASSTTTLLNVTLTDNVADDDADGSGAGGGMAAPGGTVQVLNSVVAGNRDGSPSDQHPDCSGDFETRGHNLVGIDTGCTGFDAGEDDLVGTDSAPIDPRLDTLRDNGGDTLTHALLINSAAIDAGDDDSCPGTDQRGAARPFDGDGDGTTHCDIGSFERGLIVPTNTSTATTTQTPTASATITPTITLTPSITPTASDTPSVTARPSRTYTHTPGPSPTATASPTVSVTLTAPATATATPTAALTTTATLTPAATLTPTETVAATGTTTDTTPGTPDRTADPSGTPSATSTDAPTSTAVTPSPDATDTPDPTPPTFGPVYLPFTARQ